MLKRELYYSGEAFGSALLTAAVDDFGTEMLEWEPETLQMEIKRLHGEDVPRGSLDRLEAARGLLTSNIFYKDPVSFSTGCRALNFRRMVPGSMTPADLHDVMWGITEADLLLGGTDGGDTVFSQPVARYVGVLLDRQGILDPPAILRFARTRDIGPANQALADMPELGEVFEAGQAEDRADLEEPAAAKLTMLLLQVGSLKLGGSDLGNYRKIVEDILTTKG